MAQFNSPMTRAQVRAVDRFAIDRLGLPGIVLMENAGRGVVEQMQSDRRALGAVLIACGKGNNAGDGYVIARHLQLLGADIHIVAASTEPATGDAGINQHVWLASGGRIRVWEESFDAGAYRNAVDQSWWIVDALLGTGSQGALRTPFPNVIEFLNELPGRKLAIDLPTGLDCDTGHPSEPVFRADLTCTFVAPKAGFSHAPRDVLGEVRVIDIGVPQEAVRQGYEIR